MLAGVSREFLPGFQAHQQDAQVAEWLMAADCKSAAPWSYGGSNPPLCTRRLGFTGEWRSGRWEGASKARGREQQHREALGCGVNGGASAGKARAKPEGESSNTAKPSDVDKLGPPSPQSGR